MLFQRLLKRRRKGEGPRLVVVDPRATATSDAADLHLAIAPGTDLALLCGLGYLLLEHGGVDRAFVAARTEGFAELETLWRGWQPARAAAVCGIAEADLRQLADWWIASHGALSLWSMGVNQSREGSATVAGICNLHLVSGQIGRPGAGPFSLTGQPNAMGGREVGGLAQLLPGYRAVGDPAHRAEVESHWGFAAGSISPEPGLAVWQQIEAMERLLPPLAPEAFQDDWPVLVPAQGERALARKAPGWPRWRTQGGNAQSTAAAEACQSGRRPPSAPPDRRRNAPETGLRHRLHRQVAHRRSSRDAPLRCRLR